MRKVLLATFFALFCASAVAAEPSLAILQRISAFVKSLGGYEAEFNVVAEGYHAQGRYEVAGDAYHIMVGDVEVYSDGKIRHEVDNVRKEVSVDNMNLESNNILDNPTRCFDFVGADYLSELQSRSDGEVTIYLRHTNDEIEGDIYLTVDEKSGQPKKIVYMLYDDKIEVQIIRLSPRKDSIPKFDSRKYKGYEMIDFR